ncbi:MAG: hypothetical protein WAV41_03720 [Microgenomates group bacterium]
MNLKLDIPDKIFGIDSANVIIFVPMLIIILMIIVSTNLVFVPKFEEIRSIQKSLTELKRQTQIIVDKTRYIQSIDPTELQQNEESLSSAIMPQKNSYLLVNVIRKVITRYDFQIDSFLINPGVIDNNAQPVASSKGVSRIPIKVVITGPKDRYLELIKAMERTLPILSISTFKMSNTGSLAKLDLEISAFYIDDAIALDINKLTLAELTLKKEEMDVISGLGSYVIAEKGDGSTSEKPIFVEYQKRDPFNP